MDAQGDSTTNSYSPNGKLTATSNSSHNGAEYSNTSYQYNGDGSYTTTTTTDSTYQNSKTTLSSYTANGVLTSDTWSNNLGNHGTDTFQSDGSITRDTYYTNGSRTEQQVQANGSYQTNFYNASNAKTSDTWWNVDGSYGSDTYYADGSSSGGTVAANGERIQYNEDKFGNITTTFYSSAQVRTKLTYTMVNGAHGETDYGANGASSSKNYAANGDYTTATDDRHGNTTSASYAADGTFISDSWMHADGTYGVDTAVINGWLEHQSYSSNRTLVVDTLTTQSGAPVTCTADGGYQVTLDDGKGNVTVDIYDSNGKLTSDTWQKADGSYGNDTYAAYWWIGNSGEAHYADGSYTLIAPNGEYTESIHYAANGDVLNDTLELDAPNQPLYRDSTTYSYNQNGTLSSIEHVLTQQGDVTTTDYAVSIDASGNQVQTETSYAFQGADGSHSSQAFNADGSGFGDNYNADGTHSTFSKTAAGVTDTLNYASNGALGDEVIVQSNGDSRTIYADGSSETIAYGQAGPIDTIDYAADGFKEQETLVTYFGLTAISNQVTTYARDGSYVMTVKDLLGDVATTDQFASDGFKLSETVTNGLHAAEAGRATTTTYQRNGSYTYQVSVNGLITSTDVSVFDATKNERIDTSYDANGNVVGTSDKVGSLTDSSYTLTTNNYVDGSQEIVSYDAQSRMTLNDNYQPTNNYHEIDRYTYTANSYEADLTHSDGSWNKIVSVTDVAGPGTTGSGIFDTQTRTSSNGSQTVMISDGYGNPFYTSTLNPVTGVTSYDLNQTSTLGDGQIFNESYDGTDNSGTLTDTWSLPSAGLSVNETSSSNGNFNLTLTGPGGVDDSIALTDNSWSLSTANADGSYDAASFTQINGNYWQYEDSWQGSDGSYMTEATNSDGYLTSSSYDASSHDSSYVTNGSDWSNYTEFAYTTHSGGNASSVSGKIYNYQNATIPEGVESNLTQSTINNDGSGESKTWQWFPNGDGMVNFYEDSITYANGSSLDYKEGNYPEVDGSSYSLTYVDPNNPSNSWAETGKTTAAIPAMPSSGLPPMNAPDTSGVLSTAHTELQKLTNVDPWAYVEASASGVDAASVKAFQKAGLLSTELTIFEEIAIEPFEIPFMALSTWEVGHEISTGQYATAVTTATKNLGALEGAELFGAAGFALGGPIGAGVGAAIGVFAGEYVGTNVAAQINNFLGIQDTHASH